VEAVIPPVIEWGVAVRSLHGDESGDQYLVRPTGDGALVAVVDGLGHGAGAAGAARAAISVLDAHAEEPVARLLTRCHERLRGTRGAVLSVAAFNARRAIMTWVGVGDVDGMLVRADSRATPEHLLVRGGVIGHQLPLLDAVSVPVARDDTLIFTTDGIRAGFPERLSLDASPGSTAERILVQHGKTTDDALVMVARFLGGCP
jgi:serine phosphatase RsbU (regulator of sigma subunit)